MSREPENNMKKEIKNVSKRLQESKSREKYFEQKQQDLQESRRRVQELEKQCETLSVTMRELTEILSKNHDDLTKAQRIEAENSLLVEEIRRRTQKQTTLSTINTIQKKVLDKMEREAKNVIDRYDLKRVRKVAKLIKSGLKSLR